MNKIHSYGVGDLVTYSAFGNETRCVVVVEKSDNIKNDRPGFIGITNNGDDYWGYDNQILSVQRQHEDEL